MRGRISIERYCGKERLPGGERRWRRLARAAGFAGRVLIFGYGVHGGPGKSQRHAERNSAYDDTGVVLADFSPERIRVWVRCACQTVEELPSVAEDWDMEPLLCFAHELGHHRQHLKTPGYFYNEARAERFGRMLLDSVS